MYDAREPLLKHDLTLTGDDDEFTVWNDGEEKHTTDAEGLKALGEQFEQGNLPDWYEGKEADWPFATTGKVLKAVATKAIEIGGERVLVSFYGGSLMGPAYPDIDRAGLTIDDDKTTLNWR